MLRPISPGDPDLPDDVKQLTSRLHDSTPTLRMPVLQGLLTGDAPLAPAASEAPLPALDRWSVQAHVYSSQVAAKLGVLAGLFGGSGKLAKAGASHEAKRYRVETTESGIEVEIGVAVRLVVASTDWEAKFELSVPNIAAAAQLNLSVGDAKIGIDVAGYAGTLGDLLPAPRQLDVTTLAEYFKAFDAIQRQVFGAEGLAFLTPTALAYDAGDGATAGG